MQPDWFWVKVRITLLGGTGHPGQKNANPGPQVLGTGHSGQKNAILGPQVLGTGHPGLMNTLLPPLIALLPSRLIDSLGLKLTNTSSR